MNALLAEMKAGAAMASGGARATRAAGLAGSQAAEAKAGQKSVDFSQILRGALNEVNNTQVKADSLGKEFQLGNPNVTLEETMVAMQKSSLSLQFLVQVRNKFVSAYHDIMNMPV